MKFLIENEGTDCYMDFDNLEDFLEEIRMQVKDCQNNGGTKYYVSVWANANCFYDEERE